ncbi:transglutaminase domain-containing protein [Methanobrevibacter sp.]|uniref:transglutaminase domain-containing protein n=1 Tax=Methanobrevibacter sp. TaxID=66852 RepID=UPI00388E4AD7
MISLKKYLLIILIFFIILSSSSVYADSIDVNSTDCTVTNDCVNTVYEDNDNDYSIDDIDNIYAVENNRSLVQSDYIIASDVVKYYKNATQYSAKFLDFNGNPLTNTQVKININSVNYTRTTNSSGNIIFNINLNPGMYIITAYHPNGEKQENYVTVLSTIISHNLSMFYKDGSAFKVKLINGDGTPRVNTQITLNINGVLYYRTTNSSGGASITINLIPNIYIMTVSEPNGLSMGYNINVFHNVTKNLNNLKICQITNYLQQNGEYKAKIIQENGLPLYNEKIRITVNNNNYDVYSDKQGIISKTFSFNQGTYEVMLKHLSTLNFIKDNVTIVQNNGIVTKIQPLNSSLWSSNKFYIKLTNNDGLPLSGKKVWFNINSVMYSRTTDSNGIAGKDINFLPGVYPISVSYEGSTSGTLFKPSSIYKLIYIANPFSDSEYNFGTYPDLLPLDGFIYPNNYCQNSNPNVYDISCTGEEYISDLSNLLNIYDDELENLISMNNYVALTNYNNYSNHCYDAVDTLNLFVGNCVDETSAIIGLSRCAQFPARYVVAKKLDSQIFHAWSQILLDNIWITTDVSATISNNIKWDGVIYIGNKDYIVNLSINKSYPIIWFSDNSWGILNQNRNINDIVILENLSNIDFISINVNEYLENHLECKIRG